MQPANEENEESGAMTSTVHAIYENGVFRPVEPVDLPESTPVAFEPRVLAQATQISQPSMSEGLAKVYEVLGRRYSSGYADTAARHNEHQPSGRARSRERGAKKQGER
jgi:predicted DNA-binding antitoxin AbrB/MazE fold protein